MELEAIEERTALIDPAGRRAEQVIEHRVDPLTGTVASVNTALGEKARAFLGSPDLAMLQALEESSRAGCPFCGAAERGTRYLPELAPEPGGQLRVGRSVAMPNLFSKARHDSVVIIDQAGHVLFPSRIDPACLATAVQASAELVRRTRAAEPGLVHHLVGMNFLQPGGSSVPHPHFQVHVRTVPYSGPARLLLASAAWRARTGESFWRALAAHEEADGRRWLGRTGRVEWVAAWAPAHQKEVWGLVPGVGSLAELAGADAEGLAGGIGRVISAYEEMGLHPFTLAFLSSPAPARGGDFDLQVRLCARPALKPLYANYDSWFGPLLAGDDAHLEAPESYAARIRAHF
jgi:UDPglucose--hexose-1-phosphate uridylyltransferase